MGLIYMLSFKYGIKGCMFLTEPHHPREVILEFSSFAKFPPPNLPQQFVLQSFKIVFNFLLCSLDFQNINHGSSINTEIIFHLYAF